MPGESFLGAIDALREVENRVRLIVCRQEGGAANMAEAYGKLTGRPGVCFVTRGPGVTNAAIGLHTARQDSTPMLLLIGQVGRDELGREAFQEIDYRRMLGEVTKWVDQVDDPARIPEYVARAYAIAMAGRRGPVALVFPEDVLTELAEAEDVAPLPVVEPAPSAGEMAELRGSSPRRSARLRSSAAAAGRRRRAPISFASRRPSTCRSRRRSAARTAWTTRIRSMSASSARPSRPELAKRVREADLLVAIGARLDEMTTSGYTLIRAPTPSQTLVHVHPGAEELGRVFAAALPINAAVGPFLAAAAALEPPAQPIGRNGCAMRAAPSRRSSPGATFPGPVDFRRDHGDGPRAARARRHHHQRRRQLHRLVPAPLSLSRLPDAAWADQRRDGLRLSRGDRREGAFTRSVTSSASPATAAS